MKKVAIMALLITLIPTQTFSWTFSGAWASCSNYLSDNAKAAVATVAGVVAVATGIVIWKQHAAQKAEAEKKRAYQLVLAQNAQFDREQEEHYARVDAWQLERIRQEAEQEARENQARLEAERQAAEFARANQAAQEAAQNDILRREFEEHQARAQMNQDELEFGEPEFGSNSQILRDNPAHDLLARSFTLPVATLHDFNTAPIAHINNDVELSFIDQYKQLRDYAKFRLDELIKEKNEIEMALDRIVDRITLPELKQLEERSKAIKQEGLRIADIFDKDYLVKLDKAYTNNFIAHNIDPTRAYQLLDIQPSALQAPTPAHIKAQRDKCFGEAQAQNNEKRLWEVRQSGWVFGYPYCSALAQQSYDLYLAWYNAGKPEEFNKKMNENYDQMSFDKSLLLSHDMQLDLRLADIQDVIVRRQRQDEMDAQEYVNVGAKSLGEVIEKYAQLDTKYTQELNQIAQSVVYKKADLAMFREYMHELEMIQQETIFLRENPECKQEAQRLQLNELFFEVTRKMASLENLIKQWAQKLDEPLRKTKSDIAMEKANQIVQQGAGYVSQAGELAVDLKHKIKNTVRTWLP